MASASIYFDDYLNKEGKVGVYIRFIVNRKVKMKQLFKIEPKYIDEAKGQIKRQHIDHNRYNTLLLDTITAANRYILQCSISKKSVDPISFFAGGAMGENLLSFIEAKEQAFWKNNQIRSAKKYGTVIRHIRDAEMDIPIHEMSEDWLKRFDHYLATKERKNRPNTRAKYISSIISVMAAVKKMGIIRYNPIEDFVKPKNESRKEKLDLFDFRKFQGVELTGALDLVRDMWVFAVLARGMRVYDVVTLQWSSIKAGRLAYTAQKARAGTEGKYHDIKLSDQMKAILAKYEGMSVYVFPLLRLAPEWKDKNLKRYLSATGSVTTYMNSMLKKIADIAGIEKHITTHVARHTFAIRMDDAGIPMRRRQQLLGHSKMETTIRYTEELKKAEDLDKEVEGLF